MSMHWAALLTDLPTDSSPATDAAGVAVWALQFTLMQRWQALDAPRPNAMAQPTQVLQPAWILRTPLKLACS